MKYLQQGWMIVLVLSACLLLLTEAQQRPRTRLEIMIDDFMGDMSSLGSRINAAFFADPPPRVRRPPIRQPGSIDSFPAVSDVSNDISFDSIRNSEDGHNAPNSPHQAAFGEQTQFHEFPLQSVNTDTRAQGTQEFPQQLASQNAPQAQQPFRPRVPPRATGFGIRQFVNRAMDRVRNMLPATRRRFNEPILRGNNPQQLY